MKDSVHPTKAKLLAAATALSQTHHPDAVTIDMVLEHSGVSKGSLYHHFEDFSDLIETVLVNLFTMSVDGNIAAISQVFASATTRAEFVAGLARVTHETQGAALRSVRFRRARLLAYAESRPRLMQKMQAHQARLTRAYTGLFRRAQDNSWFNTDFDPHAAAVFIQAYTIGKIVDDVSNDPIRPEAWEDLIMKIVERVFI
jgi:AcrR family transcriptional regulator